MQIIKNQILNMINFLIEENKDNKSLTSQLIAIKKLIAIM